jgi:hypothetical protein
VKKTEKTVKHSNKAEKVKVLKNCKKAVNNGQKQ